MLDVLLGSPVHDYWNVDGYRVLSALWTSFTQFTILTKNLQLDTRGPWRDRQKFRQHPRRIFLARCSVEYVESTSTKRNTALCYWNAEARQCSKIERNL